MEATILGICPSAKVIHLTHEVTPFSILEGARQMECVVSIPAAIHVCVVDPGVGGARRGIVIRAPRVGYLVGPDNGVLAAALELVGGAEEVRSIDNQSLLRQPVSSTFHGRDIFASVAGHLCTGIPFRDIGATLDLHSLVPAPYGDAVLDAGGISAVVIHVNRYGNCILNVLEGELFNRAQRCTRFVVSTEVDELGVATLVRSFCEVAAGDLLLYPDSYGRVGMALNLGDLAAKGHVQLGSRVLLTYGD